MSGVEKLRFDGRAVDASGDEADGTRGGNYKGSGRQGVADDESERARVKGMEGLIDAD